MNATTSRFLATAHLLLISPAVLFMGSVMVRHSQALQNHPAHIAQQIVMWYAGRMWTLWVLLLALPLLVLITGCFSLVQRWMCLHFVQQTAGGIHADRAVVFTFVTTVVAAIILIIVVLHMLAN